MVDERQLTIVDINGMMGDAEAATVEFAGEIHPLADLWPMVSETELEALAADIAANGLREPLVLDELGRLVDGRNRWGALQEPVCRNAGVEPRFVRISSTEARALIASRNAQRRNTTAAQRAMIGVLADWDSKHNGLLCSYAELASEYNTHTPAIGKAVRVMRWLPNSGRAVADGVEKLEAVERQALEIEARSKSAEARLEKLTAEDEEMAELVNTDALTLDEAEAALTERKRQHKERVVQASRQMAQILTILDPVGIPIGGAVENWLLADEMATAPPDDFSLPRLERAESVLRALIERRKETDREA